MTNDLSFTLVIPQICLVKILIYIIGFIFLLVLQKQLPFVDTKDTLKGELILSDIEFDENGLSLEWNHEDAGGLLISKIVDPFVVLNIFKRLTAKDFTPNIISKLFIVYQQFKSG